MPKPVLVAEIDGVGAEQHEFAMGEVEDAHHAGDDAEAEHDQHHHRGEGGDVEREFDREIHQPGTRRWRVACS